MVKYLALAGLSLLPTSPALEQLEWEPRCPHGLLCSAPHHVIRWCLVASVPCVAPYHARVPQCDQRRSQVQIRTANHSAPMTQIDQWESTRIWSVWFVCSAAVSIGHYHCPGISRADITLRGHTDDALTCHDGLWLWSVGEGTLGHVNYEFFSQSGCLIPDKLMKVQ